MTANLQPPVPSKPHVKDCKRPRRRTGHFQTRLVLFESPSTQAVGEVEGRRQPENKTPLRMGGCALTSDTYFCHIMEDLFYGQLC